jgi:hypothetical protein
LAFREKSFLRLCFLSLPSLALAAEALHVVRLRHDDCGRISIARACVCVCYCFISRVFFVSRSQLSLCSTHLTREKEFKVTN